MRMTLKIKEVMMGKDTLQKSFTYSLGIFSFAKNQDQLKWEDYIKKEDCFKNENYRKQAQLRLGKFCQNICVFYEPFPLLSCII